MDANELSERLSAYLDGTLSAKESARVDDLLRRDASTRRLLEELRSTIEAVASLPAHAAPASIVEDLQRYVERRELLGQDIPAGPERRRMRWGGALRFVAAAACLALVVWYGWWLLPPEQSGLASRLDDSRAVVPTSAEAEGPREITFEPPARTDETRSFERKLAGAASLAELRRHRFDAEPVHLRVALRHAGELTTLTGRLLDALRHENVAELMPVRSAGSRSVRPGGNLFFEGASGVNFNEARTRQLLVRAEPEKLDRILASLAADGGAPRLASLTVGDIPPADGIENIRAIVRAFGTGVSQDHGAHVESAGAPTGGATAGASVEDELLAELKSVLGVDFFAPNVGESSFARAYSTPEAARVASARSRTGSKRAQPPVLATASPTGDISQSRAAENGPDVAASSVEPPQDSAQEKESVPASPSSLVQRKQRESLRRLDQRKKQDTDGATASVSEGSESPGVRSLKRSAAQPADSRGKQVKYLTLIIELEVAGKDARHGSQPPAQSTTNPPVGGIPIRPSKQAR